MANMFEGLSDGSEPVCYVEEFSVACGRVSFMFLPSLPTVILTFFHSLPQGVNQLAQLIPQQLLWENLERQGLN